MLLLVMLGSFRKPVIYGRGMVLPGSTLVRFRGLLVIQAHKVFKDQLVQLDQQELPDPRETRVIPVLLVHKVSKVFRVFRV
jgi:hypothetical protein